MTKIVGTKTVADDKNCHLSTISSSLLAAKLPIVQKTLYNNTAGFSNEHWFGRNRGEEKGSQEGEAERWMMLELADLMLRSVSSEGILSN